MYISEMCPLGTVFQPNPVDTNNLNVWHYVCTSISIAYYRLFSIDGKGQITVKIESKSIMLYHKSLI